VIEHGSKDNQTQPISASAETKRLVIRTIAVEEVVPRTIQLVTNTFRQRGGTKLPLSLLDSVVLLEKRLGAPRECRERA
jgi:hypothetical protein